MEVDRKAYVLAHALRRLAMARMLAVPVDAVSFSTEASGKPLMTAPENPGIYFSHSRSRSLVVCAATRAGPVGVDVERMDGGIADLELLRGFVEPPHVQHRGIKPWGDKARYFFIYWTLLEAYWKSRGTGLSYANPPIRCLETPQGMIEISLATAGSASVPCALGIPLQSPCDCVATLVLDQKPAVTAALEVSYHAPAFFPGSGCATKPQHPLRTRFSQPSWQRPCP